MLLCRYGDSSSGRRPLVKDDDGDVGRVGMVSGTTGDDPDAQVR